MCCLQTGAAVTIAHDTAAERMNAVHAMTDDADRLDDVLALVDRLLRCR